MEALQRRNALSCRNNIIIVYEFLKNFKQQDIVLKKAGCGKIVLI